MIVARSDVHIRRKRPTLAPHDHRQFGVSFELDKAIDDLGASALQRARPADIGFLVEPRLELDQRGDRFSRFRSLDERAHDGRFGRCPVERLLYCDHIGVARGLLQELDDDIKRLVRMMNDEVFLADGRETVSRVIANALGIAWIVGHEFEIRAIYGHQLRELVERQNAVDQENLVVSARQGPLHESAQLDRHGSFNLEPDDRSAPPALEHGLELTYQIFRLLLDLDLGIANDTERTLPFYGVAWEETADKQTDHLLKRDHTGGRCSFRARQADEAVELIRHSDERVHRLAVARPRELQRNGEAEIRDEGEGMCGIDGERSE